MTITIAPTMEKTLKERADRLHVSLDEVVEQALSWYMGIDPELLNEFAEIESAHAEALANFEEMIA